MLPVILWRVWMTDGRIFQSSEHAWSDVPDTGVAALVTYEDPAPNRSYRYGIDEYSLTEFSDRMAVFPVDGDQVKRGAWMPDDEWEALRLAIHAEGWRL